MKYTIEGFSQQESIRLGLDVKDLVLLRWIVDFYNTGCMLIHLFEGVPYFWINYQYVLQELPVLGITSKDVLARRMKRMAKNGLLDGKVFENHRTYFRFKKDVLRGLLSSTSPEDHGELFDSTGGGSDSKVGRGSTQKSEGVRLKSRDHVDSSINDSSINDKKKRFVPPTVDEVKQYQKEISGNIDPMDFTDFYKSKDWMIGKNKMVDWEAAYRRACRTWNKESNSAVPKKDFVDFNKIKALVEEKLGRIATDKMVKDVMESIPEKAWWLVDKFLKQRYPGGDGGQVGRIETELKRRG